MIKIALFICFLPVALFEVFFYKQFGLVVVGTLYIVLAMQADRAAGKFLTNGLRWPVSTKQARRKAGLDEYQEEELHVAPLGEKKQKATYTPMRNDFPPPFPDKAPLDPPARMETPVSFARSSPLRMSVLQAQAAEILAEPNFSGRAHEVLAVPENAATRTIKRAFRIWVKKMHPDQNGSLPREVANRRVQRITEAKELLLERRRKKAG